MNKSLTDSPTWIQEMLAHLKRPSPKERHKNLTMAEVYMYLSKKLLIEAPASAAELLTIPILQRVVHSLSIWFGVQTFDIG